MKREGCHNIVYEVWRQKWTTYKADTHTKQTVQRKMRIEIQLAQNYKRQGPLLGTFMFSYIFLGIGSMSIHNSLVIVAISVYLHWTLYSYDIPIKSVKKYWTGAKIKIIFTIGSEKFYFSANELQLILIFSKDI